MDLKSVTGYWKLKAFETRIEDGEWMAEKVLGGAVVLTMSHHVCGFMETSEGHYGYEGNFQIDGNHLFIRADAGSSPGVTGQTVKRELKLVSPNELNVDGCDDQTGRLFHAVLERVAI